MVNGRKKGIKWELFIINKFKDLGFKEAASTRSSSRYLDNLKIDINFIPYWIQVKSGKQYVSPIPLLKEIEKNVIEKKLDDYPVLLIRIYDAIKGKRRQKEDILVYILYNSYNKFFNHNFKSIFTVNGKYNSNYKKLLKANDAILRKADDSLLVITFDTFIKIIKNEDREENNKE